MRYFIKVGRIESNKSGVGARGYAVERSGRTVTIWNGPIDAISGRFYWRSARSVQCWELKHRTEAEARADVKQLVRRQVSTANRSGKYTQLPPGVRIYKRRPRKQ